MDFEIITRKDAANAGRAVYFTGKECKRGHLAQRYTATGNCKLCNLAHTKKYVADMNNRRLSEAKGLATITIKVPKSRELELIMFSNSLLIEEKHEPVNKTSAETDPAPH